MGRIARLSPRELAAILVKRHAGGGRRVVAVGSAVDRDFDHIVQQGEDLGHDAQSFVANDQEQASEGRMRLARVGLENVLGWISADDYKNAQRELLVVEQITVEQLKEKISKEGDALQVLDVRQPSEFTAGHIADAVALPLGDLNEKIDTVGLSRPTAVICGSGHRSSVACSIIRKNSSQTLFNVLGGMRGWRDAGYYLVQ